MVACNIAASPFDPLHGCLGTSHDAPASPRSHAAGALVQGPPQSYDHRALRDSSAALLARLGGQHAQLLPLVQQGEALEWLPPLLPPLPLPPPPPPSSMGCTPPHSTSLLAPTCLDPLTTGNLVALERPASYVERREDGYREPELLFLVGTAHVSQQVVLFFECCHTCPSGCPGMRAPGSLAWAAVLRPTR